MVMEEDLRGCSVSGRLILSYSDLIRMTEMSVVLIDGQRMSDLRSLHKTPTYKNPQAKRERRTSRDLWSSCSLTKYGMGRTGRCVSHCPIVQ